MRIGLIGASGNIGSRVLAEALGRGHDVIAFTTQGAASRPARPGVQWRELDIFDVDGLVRAILQRLDVLVSSYHPGNSANDAVDAIGQAIADPSVNAHAAKGLLKALDGHPATRLIVIGGAANLEIVPGRTMGEDEPRLREVLRSLGCRRSMSWPHAATEMHSMRCVSQIGAGHTRLHRPRSALASARAASASAAISSSSTPRVEVASPTKISQLRSSTRSSGRDTSSAASPWVIEPTFRFHRRLSL
jgi:hypothetical protein